MQKKLHIILSLVVFILSAVSAFFFEDSFRRLIRYFYIFSTDGNISFVGKNFHLFASGTFVISFGLFCLLLFNILDRKKPFHILIVAALFVVSTFIISYTESKLRMMGCTACNDGKLRLHYNSIGYDLIFIAALAISLFPFLPKFIRGLKAKK